MFKLWVLFKNLRVGVVSFAKLFSTVVCKFGDVFENIKPYWFIR